MTKFPANDRNYFSILLKKYFNWRKKENFKNDIIMCEFMFQIESSRVQLSLFSNFVGDFVAISVHSVERSMKESSGNKYNYLWFETVDCVERFTDMGKLNFSQFFVFLCFPIFVVKLECLFHMEKKSLIIKWPSLTR